ncbi:MAG: DnaJ domain-containing protein [Pseudomonadota bacterium]
MTTLERMKRSQSTKPGSRRPSRRYHGRVEHADGRRCAVPGCKEPGEFKVALNPNRRSDEAPQWKWLCLEHVRAHNEGWNYFETLSPEDLLKERQGHPSWDGPTHPFRMNPEDLASLRMKDSHGIFSSDARFRRFAESGSRTGRPLTAPEAEALVTLGLSENASSEDIKKRYKILLKRYHPDANGGDRRGEKKMQAVIAAYHRLMDDGQRFR